MLWVVFACQSSPELTGEALWDPASCAGCHPTHHRQWSGSMHAYASIDPVFLAMDARGQRETDGELGDFCVTCHAPAAVALGLVDDASDLADVPQSLQGVGCMSCHLAEDVTQLHNNGLVMAEDEVLRGGIANPEDNTAHAAGYSPLLDRDDPRSSQLCGSCHDVVLDNGLHLERTYAEWEESLFNTTGASRLSCGHCHMTGSEGPVAVGGPTRTVHDHAMPGVDVALDEFPEMDAQLAAVEQSLDNTLIAELCVLPMDAGSVISVRLENVGAGHRWPSGAAHDRRAWVELSAWNDGEQILSTGQLSAEQSLHDVKDPLRWELHSVARDENDAPAVMFWDAVSLEERTLPTTTTQDPTAPDFDHTRVQQWPLQGQIPDEVTMAVHLRPLGLEIVDSLIESGDLDASYRQSLPTFTPRQTVLRWTGPLGSCVPQ